LHGEKPHKVPSAFYRVAKLFELLLQESLKPHMEIKMSDVMVVASKVKAFIKANGGMNTSGSAMAALTEVVEKACNDAMENARGQGRKTVMDRDFTDSSSAA